MGPEREQQVTEFEFCIIFACGSLCHSSDIAGPKNSPDFPSFFSDHCIKFNKCNLFFHF